jgi:hypothetical protein
VIIREARGDDFDRVYPLLLEFKNSHLNTENWRQLFIDHTGLQNDHFGWVLVDGDNVVGFVSTILSERTIRGETVRLCNTSSWIVKPEYRAHSLALHAKVIADKSITVTNLSPTAHVLKLLEKLGFTLMDKSERIILPVVTARTFMDNCKVITQPSGIKALKTIGGNLRLPFARVHHIGAPDLFVRHLEKLVVRVAASFKVAAMIVDDRMLHGAVPWHSFMRPGGERKAAFRSKRLVAEDIDGLYTEATILNY